MDPSPNATPEEVAYHEAGHVLLYHFYRTPIRLVELHEDPDRNWGWTRVDEFSSEHLSTFGHLAWMRVCLAGPVAQFRFRGGTLGMEVLTPSDAKDTDVSDAWISARIVATARSQDAGDLMLEAQDFVQTFLAKHADVWRTVARALHEKRRLPADETAALLHENAAPDVTIRRPFSTGDWPEPDLV